MTYGVVQSMDKAAKERAMAEKYAQRRRAGDLVKERMPDLVLQTGEACSFAVYAVLKLWFAHGERSGVVSPSMVRRERAGHLVRTEERFGTPVAERKAA